MKSKIKTLIVCIAVPLIAGALSALLTMNSMTQDSYAAPPLSPPPWLFPVVWTLLYILMGIASYLVVISEDKNSSAAIKAYGAQLLFNILWPFWFFELSAYWFSFAWLIVLLILVIITALRFCRISKPAGLLLIPYILWLLFAGYLNLAVAILN
ncbi:MAG: tryptophan-rich sensory protein [Oscillospiraceae bacterium]|nr:tryptophan-rich sensory protein [Oscillospiraceae bacterium]